MSDFSTILQNVLVIDIETVAWYPEYQDLPERLQKQWEKKAYWIDQERDPVELYHEKAGIYAEFGKIIVVGIGYFLPVDNGVSFRVTAISGDDEKDVLSRFSALINDHFNPAKVKLCGHNGKEFDFPYLARRMLINGLPLPVPLQLSGLKPWQIPHIDTLELWKFGDYKHFTSLETLASVFDIPSSKSAIDGSQVNHVYYNENDLDTITEYCIQDVIVTARLFLKLKQLGDIPDDQIVKVL